MNNPHGSLKSYVAGYILSIMLTLAAYLLVVNHLVMGWNLVFALIGLAMIQLAVQLIFFLHLGGESKPRLNLIIFSSTMLIVLVIVIGTLWIMHSLDYNHHMTPAQTDKSIMQDELITR